MFDNVSRWPGSTGSRLVKARSSPNVAKASLSVPNKQLTSGQSKTTNASKSSRGVKNVSSPKVLSRVASGEQLTLHSTRSTHSTEATKVRTACPAKTRRSTTDVRVDGPKCFTTATRNEKQRATRSISRTSSCTILEDRALLKKGLSYKPSKLTKKPEALQKKTTLDRSVSLGCVATEPYASSETSKQKLAGKERKEETPRKFMNRSTSLWSVQAVSSTEMLERKTPAVPSRLSRIPLLTPRSTRVGRSLADLSRVDRAVEPTMRLVPFDDIDLDRSMDERIYENCRETFSRSRTDNCQSTQSYSSNLEARVAKLMAQLDDDVNDDERAKMSADRKNNSVCDDHENDVNDVKQSEKSSENDSCIDQHKVTVITIEHCSEKSREKSIKNNERMTSSVEAENVLNARSDFANRSEYEKIDRVSAIGESKERKETSSIQELRRNWEKQANESSTKKESKVEAVALICEKHGEIKEERKKTQPVNKRAKDIEHLVNFFNCKNAEASRETKDPWMKTRSTSDVSTTIDQVTTRKKTVDVKSYNDYNGYISDGNCSEDSGHMSNENEVEWKDGTVQSENRVFGKEQFFRQNDLAIDMFNSSAVLSRFAAEKKTTVARSNVSTSSGGSSIESCKTENTKIDEQSDKEQWKACTPYNNGRQVRHRILALH